MRILPPELEIDPLEGFDPKKDIFKRAEIGRGLTNIVSSVADPLVIALDGQWGSGKSTFLKMWAGELRKAGFPVIYFDAFANDYVEDAFTALAGEIIGLVQDAKKTGTATGKKFAKKAVEAGKIILRSGLKVGVKVGTMGALDAADLKGLDADLSSEASQLFDKHVGALLTKRNEERATISAFREALAELPQLLSGVQQPNEGSETKKPLVFIIDELDRCRPLFALDVLERTKHFFAVPGVHFVFGANLIQLRNSIVVAYGPGIDAHVYLQKFIHLIVMLDHGADYRSERTSKRYIEFLAKQLQFKLEDSRAVELSTELIEYIADEHDLSLRAIERIFSNLVIALTVTDENVLRLPPVLAGLCILKVIHPDLYRKAKKGTLTFVDVEPVFFSHEGKTDEEKHRLEWSKEWWQFCVDPTMSKERAHELASNGGFFRYSIQREQIVPFTANGIIDRFAPRTR
jgi:tRNA A37 threonylcarbamoyladenosine biosynthesis protein TsaE